MTLPIPSSLVVQGASHLAGEVARRVGQAVGFADVLAGAESPAAEGPDPTASTNPLPGEGVQGEGLPGVPLPGELQAELVESIDRILRESGLNLDQPLQLSVDHDGSLRVVSDHERAAEIEARLDRDPDVRRLAQQWVAGERSIASERFGAASKPIDLTIPASTASILPVPGGYPNW